MMKKRMCCCLVVVLLFFGCASADLKTEETKKKAVAIETEGFFSQTSSEKDMYLSALSQILQQEKQPNYQEIRSGLTDLIEKHPKSKWSESAQSIIALIDSLTALQADARDQKKKAQIQQAKLVKDNEGLRDQVKLMEDTCLSELIRLQQENQQLKENLQQLKKLEVQLEKREKMLR